MLCVVCSKSATHVCNGCTGGFNHEGGKLQEIFYCGAECQKEHWPSHAKGCMDARDRRCLYRAGNIAQVLFYKIRETFWSTPILHIHKHEDLSLCIFEGSHNGISHEFRPFQYDQVKNNHDKNAVLAFMACRTVLVYMEAFIKEMLRGISSECFELTVAAKNHKRQITMIRSDNAGTVVDNTIFFHDIIQVSLKNNEEYMLDISGDQYGHPKPVSPRRQYHDSRIEKVAERRRLGEHRSFHSHYTKERSGPSASVTTNEHIAKVMDEAIEDWQKCNMALRNIVRLGESNFQRKQAELLAFIDARLGEKKTQVEETLLRQRLYEEAILSEKSTRSAIYAPKGPTGRRA